MRAESPPDNDAIRLLQGQMHFLARSAGGSCVFTFLLAALMSGGLWQHVPVAINAAWLTYMLTLTTARFIHARRYLGGDHDGPETCRFQRWFITGALASGLGWGTAAIILFPFQSVVHQSFLSFALAGTTASAITLYAPLKWALRCYLGLTLVPLAAVHFSQGDQAHLAMGTLVVIYIGLMFRFVTLANSTLVNALTLRDENNTLIAELKAAKQLSDKVNERLTAEIAVNAETEARLIDARDHAEQGARAKSEFLATMSHEIRTPMNGVLGMTELLLNTELSARQHRFADTIRRSGTALLSIINDILDYSKIEAGKFEIQNVVFDLRQLIEDTMVFFAEQAQRKKIELVTNFPANHHTAYRGDPERIRQVLMNLLGNAVKFTAKGEITLRVETQEENGNSTLLKISVRDSGMGIKPEHQQHIFETFQQADGSTTRTFGGTGLGLAICRRLVELMGGTIGVDSKTNVGSTFWFTLGLTKMAAAPVSKRARTDVDFTGMRVLVVDTNETNRNILIEQLKTWGIKVYGAKSANRALRYLRKGLEIRNPFEVMIFDHDLGETDGLRLARRVRGSPACAGLRLIMASSVNMLEQTGQWLNAGIDNYLTKPVRQAELLETLAAVAKVGTSRDRDDTVKPERQDISLGAHVLLAEDNPVNQELALTMLENLGCSVVLVENGQGALEAVSEAPLDNIRRPYDLILMDCQMPILDGFAATRGIRRWEATQKDRAPVPIVALTANALQGDRERCLEAGMSDYVSKPFSQAQLATVIDRWLTLETRNRHVQAVPESDTPMPTPTAVAPIKAAVCELDARALDSIRALQTDGAPNVLARIVTLYVDSSPGLLDEVRRAVADNNGEALRQAAHSLKSASANLGARKLAAMCGNLEQLGRDGRADTGLAALDTVEFEFKVVCDALRRELDDQAA